ncbi:hypothetical protein EXT67_21525 [Pectobacterium atrosepticum]|uniref:Uncharacterized protein n=1 Tax=Pectobacterium phage phiTE TaxID=1116482 RepID=K9L3T6_9CAUD|nr:hypothetical protein [Pectobacterium atrosepticum]YP_007392585.1 hypothetical protein phiTE_123 [Pectobacterium phage phiTE]AEZ66289.1 hypothetical protein phiTE_123 [Pectobacterium phage phiTE]MCL6318870.1 hypothetical protein [Pectobacterium atrosepticum]
MSEIKDVIERLARDWSWGAGQYRQSIQALEGKFRGLTLHVPTGPNTAREFTMQYEKKNGDLRLWTKSMSGLLQWRTCPEKGDRLVYHAFGRTTERLSIEEIFLDTHNVDEGEVAMFEMLYADLAPMVPLFAGALDEADRVLRELMSAEK